MPDLAARFPRKQWKTCCGKGCAKCEIAQVYIAEYGRKKGLARLNEKRTALKKAGKGHGKKGKTGKTKGKAGKS